MVDSQIQTREESEEGTIGESEGQSIDNAELIVSSPLNGDTSWTREMVNVAVSNVVVARAGVLYTIVVQSRNLRQIASEQCYRVQ